MNIPKLDTVAVGSPITRLGVSFFPLYLAANDLPPIATGEASGLVVDELDEASVQTLRVRNPGDRPVLVVEGEHFLGGKQNRALNATVLVPAGAELEIPVSCLEQGRWGRRQAYRRDDAFAAAAVRAAQHAGVAKSMGRRASREGDQSAVWHAVDQMLDRAEVNSSTAAAGRPAPGGVPSRAVSGHRGGEARRRRPAPRPVRSRRHPRALGAGDGPVRRAAPARRSLARADPLVPARITRRAGSPVPHACAGTRATLLVGAGSGGSRRGPRGRAPRGRQATHRPGPGPRRRARARGVLHQTAVREGPDRDSCDICCTPPDSPDKSSDVRHNSG